jgi:hypothetical protein
VFIKEGKWDFDIREGNVIKDSQGREV